MSESEFLSFYAQALHSYKAEDKGEVDFEESEILKIVGENEFGWWLSQSKEGRLGWVPSNFFNQIDSSLVKEHEFLPPSEFLSKNKGKGHTLESSLDNPANDSSSYPFRGSVSYVQPMADEDEEETLTSPSAISKHQKNIKTSREKALIEESDDDLDPIDLLNKVRVRSRSRNLKKRNPSKAREKSTNSSSSARTDISVQRKLHRDQQREREFQEKIVSLDRVEENHKDRHVKESRTKDIDFKNQSLDTKIEDVPPPPPPPEKDEEEVLVSDYDSQRAISKKPPSIFKNNPSEMKPMSSYPAITDEVKDRLTVKRMTSRQQKSNPYNNDNVVRSVNKSRNTVSSTQSDVNSSRSEITNKKPLESGYLKESEVIKPTSNQKLSESSSNHQDITSSPLEKPAHRAGIKNGAHRKGIKIQSDGISPSNDSQRDAPGISSKDSTKHSTSDIQKATLPFPVSETCVICLRHLTGTQVKIDRGMIHIDCFRCSSCQIHLSSDSDHKEFKGRLYCSTHYEMYANQKCQGCANSLDGQILMAMGKSWHKKCFVCTDCMNPFKDSKFHRYQDRPVCSDCFNAKYAVKCYGCSNQITSGLTVKVLGRSFHEQCFRCPIGDHLLSTSQPLKLVNDQIVCADHVSEAFTLQFQLNHGEKCENCHKVVPSDSRWEIEGKFWHKNCLACMACNTPIRNGRYETVDGKVYGLGCCV